MANSSLISVPIPLTVFVGLVDFLREVGSDRDPIEAVETAIAYWMDNADWKREDLLPETISAPPARQTGYMWKRLFLPHGTRLRMAYQRENHYARVEGDKVLYEDKAVSPGEFANTVAGGSRSAWRDLWVKRPRDAEWLRAWDLREADMAEVGVGRKIGYRDDIIAALQQLDGQAHRGHVIKRVHAIREARGASLPEAFEQTVQQAFERHCGQSEIFCKVPNLDLFCWPNGKGEGTWGLDIDKVEAYLSTRDDV